MFRPAKVENAQPPLQNGECPVNSDHPNADLVLRAFQAIQRGDIQTFWATQAEYSTASIFGKGGLVGTFAGREVRDWIPCQIYGKLASMLVDPQTKIATPTDVLAGDDHVVLIYEVTGRDLRRRMRGAIVCRIDKGKISDVQHFDPLAAEGGLEALR